MTDSVEKKDSRGTLRVDQRLYTELLDEQDRLRRTEGRRPSQTELIQRLFNAYLGREEPKPSERHTEPAITPHNDHERDLVAGLLLLFRDKREIAQGVKEIVAGLLSNWINKAKAAMPDLNGGKRSA